MYMELQSSPYMIENVQPINTESRVCKESWRSSQTISVQAACVVIHSHLGSCTQDNDYTV